MEGGLRICLAYENVCYYKHCDKQPLLLRSQKVTKNLKP